MGRKLLSLALTLVAFVIVICVIGVVMIVGWYIYMALLVIGACGLALLILATIYAQIRNYFVPHR